MQPKRPHTFCSFCGGIPHPSKTYLGHTLRVSLALTVAIHLPETMQPIESIGSKVCALVCDGASWNLAVSKKRCEISDETFVHPCFTNPFSDEKCWVIICPSHQVQLYMCS